MSADHPRLQTLSLHAGVGSRAIIGCCDTESGNDINGAGVVVGTAQQSAIVGTRGFVAAGTSFTLLSILPGANSEFSAGAVAINDAGQIVGKSPSGDGSVAQHAVLWSSAGVIQDFGTLGGTNSAAIDINNSGQVIGSSQIAGDAATHFFIWDAEDRDAGPEHGDQSRHHQRRRDQRRGTESAARIRRRVGSRMPSSTRPGRASVTSGRWAERPARRRD
jgi:probable HAF family extracellular repeat protein